MPAATREGPPTNYRNRVLGLLSLVDRYGSYNVPFFPMAALLLIGAWLWLKVDPNRPVWTTGPVPALAHVPRVT
jgi:hypothetical protein